MMAISRVCSSLAGRRLAFGLAAAILAQPALAQSNSLFRKSRQPAAAPQGAAAHPMPQSSSPSTPPAAPGMTDQPQLAGATTMNTPGAMYPMPPMGAPTSVQLPGLPSHPGGGYSRSPQAVAAFDPQMNPNPTLLAISPIGVAAPRKENIRPGALVTIIVRETKQALSDANLRSQKSWDLAAEVKEWIRLNEMGKLVQQNFPTGTPKAEFDLTDNYQGRGRVDRRDELITRITATVLDVKPNGTLVLEAKKTIELDEEKQVYTLTGLCRAEDLTPQNTVLSTQVADLRLNVQHEGAARDASRRNIWKRLADLFQLT